jgi:DUF917 family protein
MPVEIGSWNSLAPFAIALEFGIPVVNGEGAGRAVPTLDLTRLSYVSSNPTVIASQGDDYDNAKKIGLYVDDVDTVQALADAILTSTSAGFDSIGGVGLWPLKGSDMKNLVIPNTYSKIILPAGQILRDAYRDDSPYRYVVDHTVGAQLIVHGIVTAKSLATSNALDLLNVTVNGWDQDHQPVTVVVYGMNENLFVFRDNKALPAIVSPDMSCWATMTQPQKGSNSSSMLGVQPLDNSNIQPGMDVILVGIPSNTITTSDQKMLKRWKETMKPLGYAGEQISGILNNQ